MRRMPAAPRRAGGAGRGGLLGGATGSDGGTGKKFPAVLGRERGRLERRPPHLGPAGPGVRELLSQPGGPCPPPGGRGVALAGAQGRSLDPSRAGTGEPPLCPCRGLYFGNPRPFRRLNGPFPRGGGARPGGCDLREGLEKAGEGGQWLGTGVCNLVVFCPAWQCLCVGETLPAPDRGGRGGWRRFRRGVGVQDGGGRGWAGLSALPGSSPEPTRDSPGYGHTLSPCRA